MKDKILESIFIFVLITDCILPFVLGLFYKEYNHKTMLLSALGGSTSPVQLVYRLWMGVLGTILSIGAFKIFSDFKSVSPRIASSLLIITLTYALLDCIVSCLFQMGETKEMVTMASKIHGIGSAIGSTVFVFCGVLIGLLFLKSNQHIAALISFIAFGLALITFILFVISDKPQLKESIGLYEGVWQRLSYGLMYVPFIEVAIIKLLKVSI